MTPEITPAWQPNPWPGKRVLQLGCGRRPMEGAVNHDRGRWGPWIDAEWDLEDMPWAHKAPGGEFDVVVAYDLVEHIDDVLGFVNEVHALLVTGGTLIMRGGAHDNPASYIDPSHKHWFREESFNFFDRRNNLGDWYGRHYVDTLGRPLTEWHVAKIERVNADPRWPDTPDLQWTLVKL